MKLAYQFSKYRELTIRVGLIVISTVVLTYVTKNSNYDLHLALRKDQPVSEKLVIVEVPSQKDLRPFLNKIKGVDYNAILASENAFPSMTLDPRVSTYTTGGEKLDSKAIPIALQGDSDGQIRRFSIRKTPDSEDVFKNFSFSSDRLINFRGPRDTIPKHHVLDASENPEYFLKNKVIILSLTDSDKTWITPLGAMVESEIIANIFDNYFENRFIAKVSIPAQLIVCMVILFITLFLLIYLPTSLGLASSILVSITYMSVSLLLFDQLYLWTPILVPLLQIFITYIIISNYKFVLNENTKWKLARKASYMSEVEEMKSNFLSLFSHDFKTPLSKIIGITETLLTKDTLDPSTKSELEKVSSYSRDLEKYLKRILKTSQAESRNIALIKSPTDINQVIEKCIGKTSLLAKEKNISLKAELNPQFMVELDSALVEEVIFNFVENAIHFSPDSEDVVIRSTETKNHVKVAVIDKGPGIPEEIQEAVWEKFFRSESKKQGYGLGLFLSRYVIELHGGQVYLNSKPGQGSEFGFLIPFNEDDNE